MSILLDINLPLGYTVTMMNETETNKGSGTMRISRINMTSKERRDRRRQAKKTRLEDWARLMSNNFRRINKLVDELEKNG